MTTETSSMQQAYEIVSVRRAEPPPGAEGSTWHRYVVAYKGANTIDGCRQGSIKTVTSAVEEIVAQLNERHVGKHGHVHLIPTARKIIQR